MVGCTIEDNTSGSGGGIYNEGSDPVLEDCTVSSNVGKVCGGGMFSEDGVAWMTGTTFCANQPDNIIGAWVDQGGNVLSATCELPPGLCLGDVNVDYDVDVLDLLYVIAVWLRLFLRMGSAPPSSSASTMFVAPPAAATCSGVLPVVLLGTSHCAGLTARLSSSRTNASSICSCR